MSKFTYLVESDVPLGVFSGMGNTAIVSPTQLDPLTVKHVQRSATSGPQSIHETTITLELIRVSDTI